MGVLVIAESGMTWDRDLSKAFRLIDAAKACGADVCKFQWTSSGRKIQERRQVDPKYVAIYERGVQYPVEWLLKLKEHCDQVGIEFACTTYLIEDIAVVAPLVKRFKVSAYESKWSDFLNAQVDYGKEMIVSINPDYIPLERYKRAKEVRLLHCVSKYPAKLEELNLSSIAEHDLDGFSDHSAHLLSGAAAVTAGASIIESHVRLDEADPSNPDFAHSLPCDELYKYHQYVSNIRTVEKML